jgi:predicted NBD/HSP70 family sugar kinase
LDCETVIDHADTATGALLHLIRSGSAVTRGELVRRSGLGRSTVSQRVERLLADGLIRDIGEAATGGRPATLLGFNPRAGAVLVADLGATHARLAVTDLAGQPLAEQPLEVDIAAGPDVVLGTVETVFDEMRHLAAASGLPVRGIGVGVPGPVEFAAGRAVAPPIMPGWDGYPIRDHLSERYGVPALVDNDVNIMAIGEHWMLEEPVDDLLFLKVGTGIGSGLVLGGRIHRGAQGAAGDIGHIRVGSDALCRCGNTGCLEAQAGGGALADMLAREGHPTRNGRDVAELTRSGDRDAVMAVRKAGRLIGEVLAASVNLLNPGVIMVGGDLALAGEHLIAGIRENVYRRSTALSTSRLQILTTRLGDRAGITGAAAMAIETLLAPSVAESAGVAS